MRAARTVVPSVSFRWFFSVVQVVSSQACSDQYSWRLWWSQSALSLSLPLFHSLFLSSPLLLVLCSAASSHSSLDFSDHRVLPGFHLLVLRRPGNSLLPMSWIHKAHLTCFPSLRDHYPAVPDIHVQNQLFQLFCCFIISGRRVNLVPVMPLRLGQRIGPDSK